MNALSRTPTLRFLVPLATAGILIGGSVVVGGLTASAAGLPDRSAAQLLVDLQTSSLTGLSGTVVQTADLGIPELPGIGGARSSELTSLVSGTHTLRLWYAGVDKMRIALLGSMGESDIIRNGRDLWTWSSKNNSATHLRLDEPAKNHPVPPTAPTSPQEMAQALLKAVDPSTSVTTGSPVTVAGRPSYQLVIAPRDTRSLVDRITVAIDGDQHVPLEVQVFAKGSQTPSFSVGFSSVDFATPDDAQFAFNPPPGATVVEGPPDIPAVKPGSVPAQQLPEPQLVGTGWTGVLVATLPKPSGDGSSSDLSALTGIVGSLPTVSGSWGSGHLLAGKLFSVVVADDGRVAVGAVAPDLLYAALSRR